MNVMYAMQYAHINKMLGFTRYIEAQQLLSRIRVHRTFQKSRSSIARHLKIIRRLVTLEM